MVVFNFKSLLILNLRFHVRKRECGVFLKIIKIVMKILYIC